MHWGKRRVVLRASVSLAAFALTAPALATDIVVTAPAPVTDQGEFRAFVEGGAFWSDGSAVPYAVRGFELLGAFPVLALGNSGNGQNGNTGLRPNVGWDAAVGLDHRVAG